MREWNLTHADAIAPLIAADARDGHTDYRDDQVWRLQLGAPDQPALTLETRYGGRVGLARLVPIWTVGQRQVYEAQGYHAPPVLKAFAPNYLRLQASLTFAVSVTIEYWAMDSQTVGGRFTVHNNTEQPQVVRLDLIAQALRENAQIRMSLLTLQDGSHALQIGHLPHLQPVMLLQNTNENNAARPRLGRTVDLPPGASVPIRWVVSGLQSREDSLLRAHQWLHQTDWDAALTRIAARAAVQPQVETGRTDLDAALAWSQHLVLQSFLTPTGHLPHPSFVRSRKVSQGFPVSGSHAGGFNASWGGQSVPDALLIAPTVALAAPDLAEGIVRNYLAVQREDGWIDAKPGIDGQRTNVLAPPLLASLTYTVYHYTQNRALLADSLEKLVAFFYRWFRSDVDQDQDGLPEWQHPGQGAFGSGPTFAQQTRWAQGIDITTVEAPDLATYLIREARSLIRIATILNRNDIAAEISPRLARLQQQMDALWDKERGMFRYRDRDTHSSPAAEIIFSAKGDQPLDTRTPLPSPSRLILRASGGLTRKPNLSCVIEGTDASGKPAREELSGSAFNWYRSAGSATTKTVWHAIDRLAFSGLSRVYSVEVSTVDLAQPDQSLLVPLWTGTLSDEQQTRLLETLTNPAQYWRAYGISACPADSPTYDPAGVNGCGGVWPFWNTLFAWALLDQDRPHEAAELFDHILQAQARALNEGRGFRSHYNPETGEGMGDSGVIDGAVSWGWFTRLFGAFVLAPDQVMITGPFACTGGPVTWTQHGVRIERRADGTTITFPSGTIIPLPPDAEPQTVRDPDAPEKPTANAPSDPPPPTPRRPDEGLLPAVD